MDPRDVLARDKYFTLRPRPLEQWLWRAGIPASAERVFWLHWQEGMRQDWCSVIPLKRVASLCSLDVSTVTRAYQLLAKLGLIRRQDPGRDPERPFEQAVAVTEVRVPRELLQELASHPNRARGPASAPAVAMEQSTVSAKTAAQNTATDNPSVDPLAGMGGRERMRTVGALLNLMSPAERHQYEEALRLRRTSVAFDEATKLAPEQRATVLKLLAMVSRNPTVAPPEHTIDRTASATAARPHLSVFELARLRRDIQTATSTTNAIELLRQVVWSIEQGTLRRFTPVHAMRIALKKIRTGEWSRPHRMPPQWSRALSSPQAAGFSTAADFEQCGAA
jgi:hypothetical protein